MNLFRRVGLPVLLTLVCAIGVFAQSQGVVDRIPTDKSLRDTKLFDNYTPLEDYLMPVDTGQLVNASTYPFTSLSSVALEDMSSGTTQLVAASQDDTASAVTNIGFDVWFDGVRYNQFSVNANGLMRFGSTVVDNAASGRTNDWATTTNNPKLSAYWDDLCTAATGKVHYKVTGSPGSRKLIVEWQNAVTFGTTCANGLAIGNFQIWVNESSSATLPGAIQFAYGAIGANSSTNGGYGIGIGSSNTSFASVTSADDTVSYVTSANAQIGAIAAGKSYRFTPNVPAAPTGLNFTAVAATSQQLNWTDASTGEIGFAVYRSTDGTNYSFITQTAADATSYNDTALLPSTNYFYRVYSISEGALSSALSGSNSTGAPGNDTCNGAGGNWSSTATWTDGTVPTAGDNVTIGSGCTVTVDVTTAAAIDVTINSGGTLQSPTTGTVTNNNLTVSGNFTNNGTLDFSTNGDTSGAILTFGTGTSNVSFSGSGATTDVRAITVAKGAQATVVELNTTNFTVRGVNTDVAGYLTLTSGTFKISGTFTLTNRTFTTATYTIPLIGGIWLNNPNYTVAGTASAAATSNNGLLRVTQGTYNIGIGAGDQMRGGAGAAFTIEGGTVNVSGAFDPQNAVTYNQSGGTMNVGVVGNNVSNFGTFEVFAAASTFTMSGGTINVINPSTGTTKVDYRVAAATATTNITGGTVVIGATGAPASSIYNVSGQMPSTTVNSTQTMRVNNATVFMRGSTVNNNGAIDFTGTSSRYDFGSVNSAMTYNGPGAIGSAATPFGGVGVSANSTFLVTLNGPIFSNRVNLFQGGFINSGQITLGNAGTSTTVVQIGSTGLTTAGGSFDVSPVHNQGSGGQIILYAFEATPRTTGVEINPTRILTSINSVDNPSGVTLAGGDLTLSSSAAAIVLTSGRFITGSNTLILSSGTATVTRTSGYVDGNFRKTYAAAANKTFEVGTASGYSPVAINVTAGTFPTQVTAKAVQPAHPAFPTPAKALQRYWTLTGTGVTADLTFNYLEADVPGTATESNFVIMKYDGSFTQPGGTVNTTANTATITGVTSFSDWTLAEPSALTAPGTLALSSATYSGLENSGSVTVTVNRTSGTDGAVTVDYALGGGTATGGAACGAGIDYVNTGGTVSFATGEASKTFNVALCGDTDVEPDETFNVTLSNATGGATIGSPATATVTILNDDSGPTGPVTVTATAGTGTGTYNTLTEAVAAVNDGTHQGAVVININQNTTEPGSVVINSTGAGSAAYTSLLIRPSADSLTVAGTTVTGRGLIELNGADNVTIDGDNPTTGGTNRNLTLQNTAANTVTFTSVIRIALAATVVTSADGNTFRNLNIAGSSPGRNIVTATSTTASENTTFGIFSGPGASATDATAAPAAVASVSTGAAAAATASNLVISNNSVVTAARGISINAAAATNYPGLQITGNSVGNPTVGNVDQVTAVGINASGSANGLISGNTVWVEGAVAASAAGHGIAVGVTGAFGSFTIENNKVNRVQNNNPSTWSAFGINLGGANNHVVQNNFVSGVINNQTAGTGAFGTTFGAYGIRVAAGTGHKVYHNSVNLYGAMPGTTSTNLTAAFLVVGTTQTGLDVRNNIFSNQITGGNPTGTRNVSIYLPSAGTATMNLTLNNNAYFAGSDAQNRLAQVGATFGTGEYQVGNFDPTATTPATNFRAYTSTLSAAGTNDNASFASSAPPPFTSNVDLHIPAGTATRLESGGAAVGVTTDIDLDTRNATTPDIGADEFTGNPAPANDMVAVAFINPINGSTIQTGTFNPVARFNNNGTATQTNVTVRFRILNSSMAEVYNQTATIATIAPLQNVDVTFPPATISTAGAYTMIASVELPGDANPGNDSITGTFNTVVPFTGTINVGTGETFTSLTNPGGIFQALNIAGASGNIVINITSDLTAETGTVALNEIAGGFTVTIKPVGAARTISGTSGATSGLIPFNATDNVTIDGSLSGGTDRSLTIQNNATGNVGGGIYFASGTNGAQNNTIKNLNVWGTSSTGQLLGITFASSTFGGLGADLDNNRIENNDIRGAFYGIAVLGASAANKNVGTVITKNVMPGTGTAGIGRIGIYVINDDGGQFTENNIASVSSNTAVDNIGIALGSQNMDLTAPVPADVTNALVSRNYIGVVNNPANNSSVGIVMASGVTGTNTVVNNMVSGVIGNADVLSATVGDFVAGIYVVPQAGSTQNIYHNSVSMTGDRGTAANQGPSFAIAISADQPVNLVNNILVNTQTRTGATGGGGESYAIGFDGPAANANLVSNFNDLFVSGPIGQVGITGDLRTAAQTPNGGTGTNRTTLADWQTATSEDANSLSVNPLFVSTTDLHLQAASPVQNIGTPLASVTVDYDGETRSATTPDIGADEVVGGGSPGSVQFSSATYTVGEAGGTVTLTVTRTGGSSGAISVAYATANGTATGGASCVAGVDYVTANGTLNWANGDAASKTFDVTICNDAVFESNETFTATLSGATGGATIGTPNPATVTITDDDPAPAGTITVNDVRVFEGNTGGANAVFTVTYTGSSPASASVNYATASGTAQSGVDFVAASGTLSFASSNTQTVSVAIIGKSLKEANETFFLNLSGAVNATIADGQGVGIIIDEDRAYVSDFDRDLYADLSIYRPGEVGGWYILNSSNVTPTILSFGAAGDRPVPGDYDGDGKADVAVFRASEGKWYVILSTTASVQVTSWGAPGDKAVQGDYDGDGKTDFAVFRPSTGTWWILRSSDSGSSAVPFGISTDKPMQGDYDGDFKTDVAVYRDGTWYITFSSTNTVGVQNFGVASDLPVSGDFDGDGKYDLAVFRPSIGDWFVYNSLTGTASQVHWGVNGDIPVPADYDRDGTTDLAIFRPATGEWYVLRSSNNSYFSVQWGINGDIPVPATYIAQ